MRTQKIIHTVSAHAEGEVGDVIVGGVLPPPGQTLWEQSRFIAEDETLRRFMLNEPRGGVFRHVNLLVPPKNAEAAAGWIIMEPEDTPPMSGSNSMCVATVLLETGMISMCDGINRFKLEAPAGVIEIEADCLNGKARSITVTNVPSFLDHYAKKLEVEGVGTIEVSTAYGGDSFVIVHADQLGFALEPHEAHELSRLGARITDAANEQLGFHHPLNEEWDHISFCLFKRSEGVENGASHSRHAVSIKPGKIDRSPCGTGCSAVMAMMHGSGLMAQTESLVGLSLIDSRFDCWIAGTTKVGDRAAIIPKIRGRAWLTGTHQHMLDPDDPWPEGYRLSDTWPGAGTPT